MLGFLRRVLSFFRRRQATLAAAPGAAASAAGTAPPGSGGSTPLAAEPALAPPRTARWRTRLAGWAAASATAAFGALGWLVGRGALAEPDLAVSVGLQQAGHPLVLAVMVFVSQLGSWPVNALSVLAAMGAFALAGFRRESLFAGAAGLGASLLGGGLKLLWLRPRPDADLVRVVGSSPVGYSFPSGHTLFYVGFFGFLFYWCYAFLRRGRLRTALLWLLGLLIVLVGPSRVYLGHHWASDVLAAYAIGFAYLFALIRLYAALRQRGSRGRPRAVPAEAPGPAGAERADATRRLSPGGARLKPRARAAATPR